MEKSMVKKIHVVDSIMGSGKTTAAINYINEHKDWKFIFVTPYLSEVQRIKEACKGHMFLEPLSEENKKSKTSSLKYLVSKGENIVTTHALFFMQGEGIMEFYKEHNYHLIIDESPETALKDISDMVEGETDFLFDNGLLDIDKNNTAIWKLNPYRKTHFDVIKHMCLNKRVKGFIYNTDKGIKRELFEIFPSPIFEAFDEIILLTYLFEGQLFKAYLKMENLGYDYWHIKDMEFTEEEVPQNKYNYKELIHIYANDGDLDSIPYKMNYIGDGNFALSHSWYDHNEDKFDKLANNMNNYFRHITNSRKNERMWTTFVEYRDMLSNNNRYKKCFVACNTRATNDYRECTKLAYMVNRFISPFYGKYFDAAGIKLDDDLFSLSEMLQWIWRSAIRDGKEIEIYIPSERMRSLLNAWLSFVAGDTDELKLPGKIIERLHTGEVASPKNN